MNKRSAQRDLIRENLISRYDHPTADMVYQSMREQMPNISLGTVYRNLKYLVDRGEAVALNLGDGREHFDGHLEPHYHFICSQCGAIEDLYLSIPEFPAELSGFQGKIEGHSTYFYGKCKKCVG